MTDHDQPRSGMLPGRAEVIQQALAAALAIQDEQAKFFALIDLAAYSDAANRVAVLNQAFEAAQAIQEERDRARALVTFAYDARKTGSPMLLQQTLEGVQAIQHRGVRLAALVDLAKIHPSLLPDILGTVEDEQDHFLVLKSLTRYLSKADCKADCAIAVEQAFNFAQAAKNSRYCCAVLRILAPCFSNAAPQLLHQALMFAQAVEDEQYRGLALSLLAPQCRQAPPRLLQLYVEMAESVQPASSRCRVLRAIMPHLTGADRAAVVQQAFVAAQAIQNDRWSRSRALSSLAPHLSGADRELALQLAHDPKGDTVARYRALMAIAEQSDASDRVAWLQQALQATVAIQWPPSRCDALNRLAQTCCEVDPPLPHLALQAAIALPSEQTRGAALGTLVQQLSEIPPAVLRSVLEAVRAMRSEPHRWQMLSCLAPQLGAAPALLQQAVEMAQAMRGGKNRHRTLMALIPQLGEEDRVALLRQLPSYVQVWQAEVDCCRSLGMMPSRPREEDYVLMAQQARLFTQTPPMSQEECVTILQQALRFLQMSRNSWLRRECLKILLTEPVSHQFVLAAIPSIPSERFRLEVLEAVIPQLDDAQTGLQQQALEAAQTIHDSQLRQQALRQLEPQLDEADWRLETQRALATVQNIQDERSRLTALVELVPQLNETDRVAALQQALAIAPTFPAESSRLKALKLLAPHLSAATPELRQRALRLAQAIQHEGDRVAALIAIAPQLSDADGAIVFEQAIETVMLMRNDQARSRALKELIWQLKKTQPALLQRAMEVIPMAQDENVRYEALAAIVTAIERQFREAIVVTWRQTFEWVQRIENAKVQLVALGTLWRELEQAVSAASLEALRPAIEIIQSLQDEARQRDALKIVLWKLQALQRCSRPLSADSEFLHQALEITQTLQNERFRLESLRMVAGCLNAAHPVLLQQSWEIAQTFQNHAFRSAALRLLSSQLAISE